MTIPARSVAAAVLGLCLAHPHVADAAELPPIPLTPERVSAPVAITGLALTNQELADAVAATLRQCGDLQHYRIDVAVQNGTVELSGCVASHPQRAEVLERVRGVAGVTRVIDRLSLLPATAVQPVQATAPPPALPTMPVLQPGEPGGPLLPPGGFSDPNAQPGGGPLPEPVPVFRAPAPSPYDLNPPHMPPYAWPTYAPYNNFSRVAYPQAYPYQAWSFIGPCYPFPKVPPGWRAVKLEWEDGYWWFSRLATKHSWWRLRYW